MKVELQPLTEQSAYSLVVEVPADQAKQEFNKACRRIGQRVNIPGFRRGKAPLRMIEKQVGQDYIKQEALDRYLPFIFADIISNNKLDVVSSPRLTEIDFDVEKGINLKAEIDIRPELKLPESIALTAEVEMVKKDEKAEELEIQRMLESISEAKPVKTRKKVQETDLVNIDFKGELNGEAIPGGEAENYLLDLTNNQFIEDFTRQIPDKKVGETFDMDVQFPEDYFDKSLASQTVKFTVTINSIEQYVAPELTDEAAQKLGNYQTVEELKKAVAERINERATLEEKFRKQRAVVEALVKEADVIIPKGMLQREIEHMVSEMTQRFKQQGLDFDLGKTITPEMEENFKDEATQRIKTSLAFAEIARREEIKVSEDDFNAHVAELAESQGVETRQVMKQISNQQGAVQSLTDQILGQKIVDVLTEKTTFTMVEPKEEVIEEAPAAPKKKSKKATTKEAEVEEAATEEEAAPVSAE